jgi:regulator of protease activity HflC (stomatin/prohibitin superfamily)
MSATSAIDAAARRTAGVLVLAAILASGLWLVSGVTTVEPGNRAVVLRWGGVHRVVGSGLVIAWPRPIETIVLIPGAERTQTTEIGRMPTRPAADPMAPMPSMPAPAIGGPMGRLTGDAGLVYLSGSVVWTVEDPGAYVTTTRDGPVTLTRGLERAFASAAIAVCAGRTIDGVLVVGNADVDESAAQSRERLRGDLLLGLNARLDALKLGIRAQRVDVTAELPEAAKPAFAEVLSAAQQAERAVAEAKANAERQRQEASLFRSQRLSQAEALAKELTSRARVATDTIVALAQERDPQKQVLLRQRLWRERLESVMRKAGQVVAVTRSQPMKLWLSGGAP